MRKELIETAKTVEEAINSACAKLGFARDEVEWEIIDLPKKTFLGLKKVPAKVKVWKDVPDPKPAQPARQPQQQKKPASPQVKKPAPAVQGRVSGPAQSKEDMPANPVRESRDLVMTPEIMAKQLTAEAYLNSVCEKMGVAPQFRSELKEGGLCINVEGGGLGVMIGRRGETLDALQYLSGLVANRMEGEYLRITLDCGDYRTKRKSTLETLAKRLSSQVAKNGTSKTLEPMNPFERRIIHATVSEIEGVSSTSVGEEPNRRVVITAAGARPVISRGSGRDRDQVGDRRRTRRGPPSRRNLQSSSQGGTINTLPQSHPVPDRVVSPQPEKPKPASEAMDKPLYAKLDLE